jgi:heat shock protein HslJ
MQMPSALLIRPTRAEPRSAHHMNPNRAVVSSIAAITLAALQACATVTAAEPGAAASLLGAWRIDQARSEPLLDRERAHLELRSDGRFAGHTSCNSMNGSYTRDGDRIRFGPPATTRMACAELQREQEDRILTALELTATARVRPDGLLELRDAEGRGLLRASRPPP